MNTYLKSTDILKKATGSHCMFLNKKIILIDTLNVRTDNFFLMILIRRQTYARLTL